MKFRKIGAVVLTGALMAGVAGASLAQPAPPQAGAARSEMRQKLTPEQRAERRAEHLRTILQLRPEQEPALRAFLQAARPPEGARERMRQGRQEMAKLTTPERLDRQRARMLERQKRFEVRAEATKRFYAQLSPAQQKAFDAMGPGRMGRGGPRGDHDGRGRGLGHHRG